MKDLDVAAIGTCYVDINATDFTFGNDGIPGNKEAVGQDYELVAGGSAVNFCRMLSGLGLKTAFIGMSGEDTMAKLLAESLENEQVQPFITRNPNVQTNISFNMTSQTGEHIMSFAGTANASLSFEAIDTKLTRAVTEAKFLYVGGGLKLKSLSSDFEKLSILAKKHATALVIDHGRISAGVTTDMIDKVKSLVLEADYYFPSRDEFCAVWSVDDIENGIKHLANEAPQLQVVVKDSSNGAYYFDKGEVRHVLANKVDKVKDVTGAGDAFNAGVITAIVHGQTIQDSIQYGCDVAAAKISKTPTPSFKHES